MVSAPGDVHRKINRTHYRQQVRQELLHVNAPRMLAFSVLFVLLQAAALLINAGISYAGTSVILWFNPDIVVGLRLLSLCLSVCFAVLFGVIMRGHIRSPKTQRFLMHAALILLTLFQLFFCIFELGGGFSELYLIVFVLMLGILPVLPRVQSALYLAVWGILSLIVFFGVLQPNTLAAATSSAVAMSAFMNLQAPLTIFDQALSAFAIVVIFASYGASWLTYGLVSGRVSLRREQEERVEEYETLAEQRIGEFKEKAHAAEIASLAKTRFLTRVSHEMRTSMNTISGMLFLAKESDDPQSQRESLDAIELASEKLKNIADRLIDTDSIEADFAIDDASHTFDFFRDNTSRQHESDEQVAAPDLTDHTILIVEDLETNRMVLREFLKETNATVVEAVDGKMAVELFAASPEGYFSFIFMDLLMPEMNGYDATRTIRKMERADALSVPIVAVSANAYKEDIEASLAAGMDAHLAKPIAQSAIFRLLIERLS